MRYVPIPLLLILLACGGPQQEAEIPEPPYGNLAAEGFNSEGSDPEAIAIADSVMESMGGRKAWDETRYLSWVFFDRRKHYWDRYTGDVRIELLNDTAAILMNINSMEGKLWRNGEVEENPDSLVDVMKVGKHMWINDSYWLILPFKLKDSGVTLTYLGEKELGLGLQLHFDEVGFTPENKYHVYVDPATYHVVHWKYFDMVEQDTAVMENPWTDYARYGNILLSGGRGENGISEIAVYDTLPPSVFESFEAVEL